MIDANEVLLTLIHNDVIVFDVWKSAKINSWSTNQFLEACVIALAKVKASMEKAILERLENR